MSHSTPAKSRKLSKFAIELSDRGDLLAQPREHRAHAPGSSCGCDRRCRDIAGRAPAPPRPFPRAYCGRRSRWCGNEKCRADFPLRSGAAGFLRPRPRIRRSSRAAPAGCNRDRARDKIRFIAHFAGFSPSPFLLLRRGSVGRRGREPIFIQGPAALQRAISHHDVVLFASGKIIERETDIPSRSPRADRIECRSATARSISSAPAR